MSMKNLVIAGIVLMLPAAAGAASLSINPGLWETTTTRTNPMTGQPTTETTTECVKDQKFDPREMMQDTQGCQLTDENLSGDTLSFSMSCSMQGGAKADIQGVFQTDGTTGNGKMDMSMSMGGMNMNMNMQWDAKRLGDC